jgi:hypothetical protein
MRDLVNNLGVALALSPAVQAATIKGTAIDLRGFDSVMFVVNTGAIASAGNFTVTVEESDTTTDGDFAAASLPPKTAVHRLRLAPWPSAATPHRARSPDRIDRGEVPPLSLSIRGHEPWPQQT